MDCSTLQAHSILEHLCLTTKKNSQHFTTHTSVCAHTEHKADDLLLK